MAKHLIAATLLMCLAACSTPEERGFGTLGRVPAFPFAGSHWLRNDDTDASPHYPTLDFDANSASGYAGCNTWRADITTRRPLALRFGPIATTRMSCPPSSTQTERNFLTMLTRARSYDFTQWKLFLHDENHNVIAVFVCADESCPGVAASQE